MLASCLSSLSNVAKGLWGECFYSLYYRDDCAKTFEFRGYVLHDLKYSKQVHK